MAYWVYKGGEVKSVEGEEGVVKGWGIVFGSPEQTDRTNFKDYFTADTFVRRNNSFEVDLFLNHGMKVKDSIGSAMMEKASEGWFVKEAKFDLSLPVAKETYEDIKSNLSEWGFSTGALSHLVERETAKNNTHWIKRWPVGELTVTKIPAEQRAVVTEIKSLKCGCFMYGCSECDIQARTVHYETSEDCVYQDDGSYVCTRHSVDSVTMDAVTKHLEAALKTLKQVEAISKVTIPNTQSKSGFITVENFNSTLDKAVAAKTKSLEEKVDAFLRGENKNGTVQNPTLFDGEVKAELEAMRKEVAGLKELLAQKESEVTVLKNQVENSKTLSAIFDDGDIKDLLTPIN